MAAASEPWHGRGAVDDIRRREEEEGREEGQPRRSARIRGERGRQAEAAEEAQRTLEAIDAALQRSERDRLGLGQRLRAAQAEERQPHSPAQDTD